MKLLLKNRVIFLICILIFTSLRVVAQNSIVYEYDNSGNRISRVLSAQKSAFVSFPTDEKKIKVKEELSDLESSIKIYPNPTEGILRISLQNYPDPIKGRFQVYDLRGTVLKQSRIDSQMTEINLSDISNGIYVLRIIINGNRTDYKIVKQN